MKTHKFDIVSQAAMSLARVQTLISSSRAWMCAFLGPFLAHSQPVIAHFRPIGRNTTMSSSPLIGSGERLHRGDIGSQYTATSEGQHWAEESEKNNYHYPCQEKLYRHEGINLGYTG